ncbi:MAG: TIGR03905 family TSCPD domain-containing protein [Clostridiales bacterium]|nr:TIGR03905 family TSCPD domain-containing protein [Clostridiales bacterium]
MRHHYRTKGTCSSNISFDLKENKIYNVTFVDGCSGNLQALGKLVEGMTLEELEERLSGIHCGPRPTSCADQLCKAVRRAYEEERGGGE